MGEDSPTSGLGESTQATMDHINRLVRKRDVLSAAIQDAIMQLTAGLSREHHSLTASERVAIYDAFRSWKVDGIHKVFAASLGASPSRLVAWRTNPPDNLDATRGTFPLYYQIVPDKGVPTVYVLLQGQRIMYVGQSVNVRARLQSHWANPDKRERITGWQVHVCATPAEANELEGTLIFQHQPPLNKADKHRRRRAS